MREGGDRFGGRLCGLPPTGGVGPSIRPVSCTRLISRTRSLSHSVHGRVVARSSHRAFRLCRKPRRSGRGLRRTMEGSCCSRYCVHTDNGSSPTDPAKSLGAHRRPSHSARSTRSQCRLRTKRERCVSFSSRHRRSARTILTGAEDQHPGCGSPVQLSPEGGRDGHHHDSLPSRQSRHHPDRTCPPERADRRRRTC